MEVLMTPLAVRKQNTHIHRMGRVLILKVPVHTKPQCFRGLIKTLTKKQTTLKFLNDRTSFTSHLKTNKVIIVYISVFQPPGRGPVPGPGINYTGLREVLLEVVILVF